MACGGCGKRRAARRPVKTATDLMGQYKYLTNQQLNARLEVYKRNNCKKCPKRYECNWGTFLDCKKDEIPNK